MPIPVFSELQKHAGQVLYVGLLVVAIGLPNSKFLMSSGQFIMLFAWLLQGKYLFQIKQFLQHKPALIVTFLFAMHVLGLLHTSNMPYAINDLRVKLPIFLLPFILSAFPPLSNKQFTRLWYMFILSVVVTSLIGLSRYFGWFGYTLIDKRELSMFISHIRFGILMALSIVAAIYLIQNEKSNYRWLLAAAVGWLLFFMAKMGFITGLCVLAIVVFVFVLIIFFRQKKIGIQSLLLLIGLLLPFIFLYLTFKAYTQLNVPKEMPFLTVSSGGEIYMHTWHDMDTNVRENGFPIYRNIAPTELEEIWEKRSKLKFSGKDLNNQDLSITLIRFLSSKGLNKDAEGVNSLSEKEIQAVEKGVANAHYITSSAIKTRLFQVFWEFDNYRMGGDYNGHSIVMRWEYWKNGWDIFQHNWLIGVGTGDIASAYEHNYNKHQSPLKPEFRLRAHNQFITFALTFGLGGLLLFLYVLFYPFFCYKLYKRPLFLAFFIIVLASFITEDTLESQAGVTLFVFFYCLLALMHPNDKQA